MSWNDDPKNESGNGKDPWGSNRPNNGKKQGPPDLDVLIKQLQSKLSGAFGGKGKRGGAATSSGDDSAGGGLLVGLVIIVLLIIWGVSGIFIVSPTERGVITRFGKFVSNVGPGPHWVPRFIEKNHVVGISTQQYDYTADMLTKDENIVSVAVKVQYNVENVKDYLFNVVSPNTSLQQATASALRQVVGHTSLDQVLTIGREKVRDQTSQILKSILKIYQPGLLVTDVTLQPAKPPEAVTAAFDDAIKAREDQQRYINKATAYAKQVVAHARGQSARIMQEADAYQKQVVLNSQAAVAAYLAILPEYEKAPGVTRERMYLGSIESVLNKSSKIFVDVKGSNNLLYLPIDKLTQAVKGSTDDTTKVKTFTEPPVSTRTTATTSSGGLPYPTRPAGYPAGGAY